MKIEDIIDSLYKIMCTATTTAVDSRVENNDYFKRRVLGFRAEIELENYINSNFQNAKFIEGGQFLSKRLSGSAGDKNKFIYTTISEDDPSQYETVYSTISMWDEVESLYFIRSDPEHWELEDFDAKDNDGNFIKTTILKPVYTFYLYDKMKNKFTQVNSDFSLILSNFSSSSRRPSIYKLRKREQFEYFKNYDLSIVRKIYANRYFIDRVMREASGKQIIDLDGFLVIENRLRLVEIKEKSPILNNSLDINDWQFGWDSRRILWYLYLLKNTGLSVMYCVREIEDRITRKFVKWDIITLDNFLEGTSWSSSRGGGGGEDTLLAPYSFFKDIDEITS